MTGKTAIWLALCGAALGQVQIKAMEHDIQGITAMNFNGVIGKFRDNKVNLMWLYGDSAVDTEFLDAYNDVAKQLKGMVPVTAMDCTQNLEFCDKYGYSAGSRDKPFIVVFPPNPIPHYVFQGEATSRKLFNHCAKLIPSFVESFTDLAGLNKFVTTDPTKPKVILFSDKDKVPTLFKALSSETVLHRTSKFSFVKKDQEDLCAKFSIKQFPTILRIHGDRSQHKEKYKGKMEFRSIMEWVNLHSESGMGDTLKGGANVDSQPMEDSRPWLMQEVPEMTKASHKDVCFKNEGLCVILLKDSPLSGADEQMMKSLKSQYTSKLSERGTVLKWMWMDMNVEQGWKEIFEPAAFPSVIVFNPHKRLRFVKSEEEGPVTRNHIESLIEKILGGDARFKMLKGQKLPKWGERPDEKGDKKKEEL